MSNPKKRKKLRCRWDKREKDFLFFYPDWKANGSFLNDFLHGRLKEGEFLKEMVKRGYDLTTLKIEITKVELPND
jgi:hypothetical protein